MPNPIKYNASAETLALQKGNFWIGTGAVGKGPTSTTGYYNGITPPSGGYTLYLNKASGGPSIYCPANDAALISLTNSIAGASYTTAQQCFNYYYTQTDKMCLSQDYPVDFPYIVLDGLVLYVDAGITLSYPGSGTTWTDINGLGPKNNGTLINGPTYSSANGGYINFDGVDDYFEVQQRAQLTEFQYYDNFSIEIWVGNPINQYLFTNRKNTSLFFSGWAIYNQGNNIQCWIGGYPDRYGWRRIYAPINANGWNHIVYTNTFDYLSQKVYVNGVDVGYDISRDDGWEDSIIDYAQQPYHVPVIGTSPADGYTQNGGGKIPIARVYNKTLTGSEVQQNFNAQKSRFGL
jgi:hypothetical protein